jgi:hypothetical protein
MSGRFGGRASDKAGARDAAYDLTDAKPSVFETLAPDVQKRVFRILQDNKNNPKNALDSLLGFMSKADALAVWAECEAGIFDI